MRCPKCQNELGKDAVYCSACGQKIMRKNALETRIETYYDEDEAETWTIEEMEQQMVQPLSKEKRKRQMIWIVAVAIVCLATMGAVFFFSRNQQGEAPKGSELTASIAPPEIRETYYEQGMILLEQATNEANRQHAAEIGGAAFLEEMDRFAKESDRFFQQAETEQEKHFAEAVESVSLFALSNDGEAAFVEELGGRNDEAADERLSKRMEQAKTFIEALKQAQADASFQALNQEIERANAEDLQTQ